ncbi:MAG: EAL domain-containing protein, partial [Sedimenticolaceae bacterium]
MPNVSPIIRLSVGLILLTVSLLLVGDMLGLTPDPKRAELAARKAIAEALAVQVSQDLAEGRIDAVRETVVALQKRNENVLSVGLRAADGRLLAMAGDHLQHWEPPGDDKSTSSHIQVPIHGATGRWGAMEVSFQPFDSMVFMFFRGGSIATVILFVTIFGFGAYWIFLKRALNELDPSAVVPDRVRAALDVLAEGLVIIDKSGRVVLANKEFERKFGQVSEGLLGTELSALDWQAPGGLDEKVPGDLPWKQVLSGGEVPPSRQLKLRTALKELISFAINVAPIKSPDGSVRGAVVTFDDVTELERKNTDLEGALDRLKQSQREISRQNRELQVLATRDALTGSLNRRSLFDGLATLLGEAAAEGEPISCIMADIDHFKSINDRFGHATGDKVIKLMAGILADTARADDLVGRYGGEEFCVILPGAEEAEAAQVAERMREAIHDGKSAKFTSALRISASFGVSTDTSGKITPGALVDLADKALYVAKESGRNRVVRWSEAEKHTSVVQAGAEQASAEPTEAVTHETAPTGGAEDLVDATEQQRLLDRIAELEMMVQETASSSSSGIDEATGLPNRVVLMDRISQGVERCRRFGTRLAVLFVDIDTLQVIRNTHGNVAAEKFLKLAASRIKKTLRSTDTVAIEQDRNIGVSVSRVGGGEFVVLLTDMREEESVTWVSQRMFAAMREPVRLDGHEVVLDTRVGVSLYPADSEEPDTLLANAGAALREAKAAAGRDICMFFSGDMNARSSEQLRLEGHLHRAVERNELFLEYQPLVDMRSGRISGFEALIRWRHPELGLVRPDRFIPMAEHAGLMDDIGDWVLQNASQQLKAWHDAGYEKLVMAINFSAVQLRREDLPERVVAVIERVGVKPGSLTAEITESALVQNLEKAASIVDGLSRAGLRVALDDFGTGYSSLSYLKRFPIDVVKIDRSFIRDFPSHIHDTAIVSAVVAMAHSLGLQVVAEGVENDRQLQVLQNLQCDEIQGYLFSKPVSREHATALLASPAEIRRMVRAASQRGLTAAQDVESLVAGVLNEPPVRRVA